MTRKQLASWAPGIAIGLIVLGAIAADYWLVPSPKPAAPPPATEAPPAPTPPASAGPPQEPAKAEAWSTYHGTPGLTGLAEANLPDRPGVLWQHHVDGAVFQPAVADEQGTYIATRSGTVVALDFGGQERWSKSLAQENIKGGIRIDAPITCVGSSLLLGALDGTVYCLDSETGETRWTYDVGGPVLGAINSLDAGEGRPKRQLFVLKQDDGALHSIDFDTGQRLWQAEPINRADGSLAVVNETVVYGSCAAALHVVSAVNGRLLRSVEFGSDCQIASGPAVIGPEIYSGSRCGRFVRADAATGGIVWSNTDSPKEIFSTPAVGTELVLFGSEDGGVYALDRETGRQKWRFDAQGLPSSPVLASDKVVVASDGVVRVLRLDTGEELWNYEVSDGIASPSIIRGMIVVGSEDGTVIAFGAPAE